MNLNNSPTKEHLAELLRGCDDRAGHHVLWVDRTGEVHITRLPKEWPPPSPGSDLVSRAQLRLETFQAGNAYVGPEAAADDGWVTELLDRLTRAWAGAKRNPEPVYESI